MPIESPSAAQALAAWRRANGIPVNAEHSRSWRCRLGPLVLTFPNAPWRRRALTAHDLHHMMTGYDCSLSGECEMAAWELGAGWVGSWRASLFCLPLLALGLAWRPVRTVRAWRAGLSALSLHQRAVDDALLSRPYKEVRTLVLGV